MKRYLAFSALLIVAVLLSGCDKKPVTGAAGQAKPSQAQAPPADTPPTIAQSDTRKMTRMSVEEARRRAPFKVLEPAYLPAGAVYDETRYIEFDGQVFVVLQYKFEGKDMYFQVDEYSPAVRELEAGTQPVRIGDYDGEALLQHGFTLIRWTQDGTRLMLNGAIDEAEAMKVARSFK